MRSHKILGVIIVIFSLVSFGFAGFWLMIDDMFNRSFRLFGPDALSRTELVISSLLTGFLGIMMAKSKRWAFIIYSATVMVGALIILLSAHFSKEWGFDALAAILILPHVLLLLPVSLLRPRMKDWQPKT